MIKFGRIFLIIFVLGLLIVPLFHVNTAEITDQENRTLAKFPVLEKEKSLNFNYAKEFESWLGDRFWGRSFLVMINAGIHYVIERHYQKNDVISGDDGWLFYSWQHYSSASLTKEAIDSLIRIKKFCNKNNIQLFLILRPTSVDIYTEYYPLEYDGSMPKLTADFLAKTDISIILPHESLRKEKNERKLFFKKDHHWTDEGALVAYKDFVFALKKAFPHFPEYNSQDFEVLSVSQENYRRDGVSINSFCKKLGIDNSILCSSEKYPYYRYKNEVKQTKIENIQKWGMYKYYNPKGFPLKTILIGRSHTAAFKTFLSSYVRDVTTIDIHGYFSAGDTPSLEPYIPFIKENKTNVLIILLYPTDLKQFF